MKFTTLVLSLAASAPVLSAPAAWGWEGWPEAPPSVTTEYGTWNGKSQFDVDSFRGIPYAKPPVGNLRYAPPVANDKHYGQYDSTEHAYACPQMNLLDGALPGELGVLASGALDFIFKLPPFVVIAASNASEDCLTVNIQRPAGIDSSANLPVFLWIFGGAYITSGPGLYDGTSWVKRSVDMGQPMIFVSINYRFNSFGFLPGKEVAADPTTSVNAGLLDQRLAMEWVADNIGAFGGDPTRVTVAGESAGAISIAFHLIARDGDISYKGKPLFRGAIMQSGSPLPVHTAERGQETFDTMAKFAGCSDAADKIACLRAAPYETLVTATNLIPGFISSNSVALKFLPRTDGKYLTDQAQHLVAAGKYAQNVAIISGDQYDEGTILTLGTLNLTTHDHVDAWVKSTWFPDLPDADRQHMLSLYPEDVTAGSPFDTGYFNRLTPQNKRISALIGDLVFQAPRRSFLSALSKTQNTWGYLNRALHYLPVLGSCHGGDLLSTFILPSEEWQARWIAFTNTLNPNTEGFPYWPEYGSDGTVLELHEGWSVVATDDFRKEGTDYMRSVVDNLAL